jgi:O-antigen/teichoic acid export membrane protein
VVIARGLGLEGNGVYAGLTSLLQGLLVASAMGADAAINRHIPQFVGQDSSAQIRALIWRIVAVRIGLLAVAGAAGFGVASLFVHPLSSSFREYALVLICYGAVRAAAQLMGIALVASFRPAATAIVSSAVRILELLLLILLSRQSLSIGLILAVLASTGGLQIVLLLYSGRGVFLGRWGSVMLRPVLVFGLVYWVNSIVDFFLGRFGDLFLLSLLLPEQRSASLYDVASALGQAALLATTAGFAGLTFAMFSRAASEPDAMNRLYSSLVRVISLLTIPLFAFLLFHGERIVVLFYSSTFAEAGGVLQIFALFRLGSRLFAGGENAEYLLAGGRVVPLVAIGIVAAALNIGLDLLLIPVLRAQGAALASGVANLTVNWLGWWLVRRAGGPRLQLSFWLEVTGICVASSWLAGLLLGESLPLLIAGYAALSACVAWWVKPLRPGDLEALRSLHPLLARLARPFARSSAA